VDAAVESAHRGPVAHRIASGAGWSIEDVVCDLGPNDRPSDVHFNRTTIAAVLAGTFECGTRSKKALLYPGSFLLGNAGSYFECGHDHGGGDHCVAFHFDTALFEGNCLLSCRLGPVPLYAADAALLFKLCLGRRRERTDRGRKGVRGRRGIGDLARGPGLAGPLRP